MSLEVIVEKEDGRNWRKEFTVKILEVEVVFIEENTNFAKIEIVNLFDESSFFVWKSYQQFLDFYEKIKEKDSEITTKSPFPTIGWIKSWFKSNDNLQEQCMEYEMLLNYLIEYEKYSNILHEFFQMNENEINQLLSGFRAKIYFIKNQTRLEGKDELIEKYQKNVQYLYSLTENKK
eukprot:gene740-8992_t